jgi:hypothetical protein
VIAEARPLAEKRRVPHVWEVAAEANVWGARRRRASQAFGLAAR